MYQSELFTLFRHFNTLYSLFKLFSVLNTKVEQCIFSLLLYTRVCKKREYINFEKHERASHHTQYRQGARYNQHDEYPNYV